MADPIRVPPALYWEFRARLRDAELALVDLQRASAERWRDDTEVLQLLHGRLERACALRKDVVDRIKAEGGIDSSAAFTWDDDTCALTET